MQIINNKITIGKGETPTYDVAVIDKNTEAPYMLPKGIVNPVVEFIVRPSIYNRDDDFVFRTYLTDFNGTPWHKFDNQTLENYSELWGTNPDEPVWKYDYVPSEDKKGRLYQLEKSSGEKEYRYYDESQTELDDDGIESHWIPYEFRICFKFPYEATSSMEAKQYKYEVTLFDATVTTDLEGNKKLTKIAHKEFLREATDFIVGGSLSE